MKGKDLLALLGDVDGQYVEELLEHRTQADVGRSGIVRRCLTVSGAAACMVLTVGIVGKAVAAYQNRAENPQEQQTTIAALQTETTAAQTTMEQETYIQTTTTSFATETTWNGVFPSFVTSVEETETAEADTEILAVSTQAPITETQPQQSETIPNTTTVSSSVLSSAANTQAASDTEEETTTTTTTTTNTQLTEHRYLQMVLVREPDRTVYLVGQSLDLSGGLAYAVADNEASGTMPLNEFEVDASAFDNTKQGTYPIYIRWHGASVMFYVKVLE